MWEETFNSITHKDRGLWINYIWCLNERSILLELAEACMTVLCCVTLRTVRSGLTVPLSWWKPTPAGHSAKSGDEEWIDVESSINFSIHGRRRLFWIDSQHGTSTTAALSSSREGFWSPRTNWLNCQNMNLLNYKWRIFRFRMNMRYIGMCFVLHCNIQEQLLTEVNVV